MYTMDEIIRLQQDAEFLEQESNRFCLIDKQGETIDSKIVSNQAKFCIIQVINDYKQKKITRDRANYIINKIDAIVYAEDMLGSQRIVEKLNQEVIGEELFVPHFNGICIECERLYDSFK